MLKAFWEIACERWSGPIVETAPFPSTPEEWEAFKYSVEREKRGERAIEGDRVCVEA